MLQEHAKLLLSLMDRTDASRNALEYFEWCQEVEDFTENSSTGTHDFHGQSSTARSDDRFSGKNTQKFNNSQDVIFLETKKNGSTKNSFDTLSLSVPRKYPYNNEKGACGFKEEAHLKRPEIYENHTDGYSSSCRGSRYLSRTRVEDGYSLSLYQSASHRASFDSTSSSSLGSCKHKKQTTEENCLENDTNKNSFDTLSSVPMKCPFNNEQGAACDFKEEAHLKRPEIYENHTDGYSSSCRGSRYLSRTRVEDGYFLSSSLYQSASHRVSFDSTSSSSLDSSEYKKTGENCLENDRIDERLINYCQQEPARNQHQTSNVPTIDQYSHHSNTSGFNDFCNHGDFPFQNTEW